MPAANRRKPPKNCYWRGDVLWGRIEVAGREIKWSLRTGDAAAAKRRVAERRAIEIGRGFYGEERRTYEEAFAAWSEHVVSQVSAGTHNRYAVSLGQLAPFLRPLFIDEITKATVNTIVTERRRAGASTATIRRDLTALSRVLEFAEDQDWREGNPALDRLRKLKERRDPIVLPDHSHIARMAARAPGAFSALIRAALATGCRQNELVAAERRQFDPERRQLTVRGKGNKIRVVDLDFGGGYDALRSLPAALGCKWLFWHGDGEPYRNVSSRFAAMVAGVAVAAQKSAQEKNLKTPDFRPFRFHDLRHRHAVDWLKEGRSIYELQKRLGHRSIKTTEIYLDFLTPEEADRVKAGTPAQFPAHVQRFAG